jgi:hypothetical protein
VGTEFPLLSFEDLATGGRHQLMYNQILKRTTDFRVSKSVCWISDFIGSRGINLVSADEAEDNVWGSIESEEAEV